MYVTQKNNSTMLHTFFSGTNASFDDSNIFSLSDAMFLSKFELSYFHTDVCK